MLQDCRPDVFDVFAGVDDYEAMGDMERARRVLGQILAINKSSIAAWRRLRALYIKRPSSGAFDEAIKKARERLAQGHEPERTEPAGDHQRGLQEPQPERDDDQQQGGREPRLPAVEPDQSCGAHR